MGGSGVDDAVVAKAAATIVGNMEDRLDELTRSTQEYLVTETAELREDRQLLQLLRDTVSSKCRRMRWCARTGWATKRC